jgi:16S rRNA (cytosine967-C5)-methyltransferase
VLGALLRSGKTLPDPPNLPDDVALRWSAAWGDAVMEAARPQLGKRAPIDLSLRDASRTAEFVEQLGGQSLLPGHVRLPDLPHITELPGFEEGAWWVQDLAASLPARLLGAGEGRHVLDLCAAPGGKTMQLAAAGWCVTAVDSSARRLERLSDNLSRTGLSADTVAADVLNWEPATSYDAILLDAPCSATGIFRRHPDVLYRASARHIREMADLQAKMLARVAGWLKPDGVLVYATCSLEREEGEAQIDRLREARPDFEADAITPDLLPAGVQGAAPGQLRLLPGMLTDAGGLDGFFMARLRCGGTD